MRGSRVAAFAALAVSLACGDGGSSPSPDKFAGTWDATKLEFTNVANSSEKVDVITLGATLVVVFESTGDYGMTLDVPGEPTEVITGTWSASADVFTIRESGSSGNQQFDWNLNGTTLTLSGANGDFDFDGDDIDEPAKVTVVLLKQ